MTTEVRRVVAQAIESELSRVGKPIKWLSQHSGIDAGLLQQKLSLQTDFTVVDLAAIARALDVPVANLTPPLPPLA